MLTRRSFLWQLQEPCPRKHGFGGLGVGCQTNAFQDQKTLAGLRQIPATSGAPGCEGFEPNIRNVSLATVSDVSAQITEAGHGPGAKRSELESSGPTRR